MSEHLKVARANLVNIEELAEAVWLILDKRNDPSLNEVLSKVSMMGYMAKNGAQSLAYARLDLEAYESMTNKIEQAVDLAKKVMK